MSSDTINPSIDSAALLTFRESLYALAQQTKSKLSSAGVIQYLPSKGKTNNVARIGRLELVEVNARNPDKVYGDYALDNRQFSKRRFTKTIQIDAKYDINELLKDPTSDILAQLDAAKERVIDRVAIQGAVGSVLVGAPDAAPTTITAAQDGVITIDATAGFTYEIVEQVTENFINNDLPYSDFKGSVLCVTGSENTDLMGEVEFINNQYINGKPTAGGIITEAGTYRVELFAGSKTGGIQVSAPILPEGTTTRQCVALAPGAIFMSMELAALKVKESDSKVNSWDITIDFWINSMRAEGVKVQIITTTI